MLSGSGLGLGAGTAGFSGSSFLRLQLPLPHGESSGILCLMRYSHERELMPVARESASTLGYSLPW